MECGTLCDVERGRVWAVTRHDTYMVVVLCECGKWWDVECGGVLCVMWNVM